MSASICFFTRPLFNAGFLLFKLLARMAKVLYFEKSMARSNSMLTFCA